MDELRLGFTPALRAQSDLSAWLRNWQLGQVVRAQVIDASTPGTVLLRIADRQVAASTGIFLQNGAWLNLQVTGLVPSPVLRVLDTPPRSADLASPVERQAQLLLSRQGSVVEPLLTLLGGGQTVNLLSLLGVRGSELDAQLQRLLGTNLPRSAEALKKALIQSGLYFESDLARQGAPQPGSFDLKALLFRLLARVVTVRKQVTAPAGHPVQSSTPSGAGQTSGAALAGLQNQLEGALAALSLHQLNVSQLRQPDAWIWVFHVPFRLREGLHNLSVTLRREKPRAYPEAEDVDEDLVREWKALLMLDLPQLGALEIDIFLRGDRVSAVFYTPEQTIAARVEKALPSLESALAAGKFEVGVLRAHVGQRDGIAEDTAWASGFQQRA